jgi:hypothetical protein
MPNSTRTIDVLLKEVIDPALRSQLADAINTLRKQTRFGLVFEKHHPEVSRLPEVIVRNRSLVARRNEKGNVLYRVENITKGKALCLPEEVPASSALPDTRSLTPCHYLRVSCLTVFSPLGFVSPAIVSSGETGIDLRS